MLKIRRSYDRLIFNKGIPYMGKMVFILKRGPEFRKSYWVYIRHVGQMIRIILIQQIIIMCNTPYLFVFELQ